MKCEKCDMPVREEYRFDFVYFDPKTVIKKNVPFCSFGCLVSWLREIGFEE
jgi:hypothetical protein